MKRIIFSAAMLIAVSASVFYCKTMDNAKMNELTRANIEALAANVDPREDCESGIDLCEMLVIYPDGWGFDIIKGVKKPGWL